MGTSSIGEPGGDPLATGKTISGLIAAITTPLALWLRRRGLVFRVPTAEQRDDIAMPMARILVRHLPMDKLGPDLADIAEAAAATTAYGFEDGPLVTRLRSVADFPPADYLPSPEEFPS